MRRTEAEKRLIKEIQRIKHNLERSLKRVSKHEIRLKTTSPARTKFEQIGKISVANKNLKELKKLRRKLMYVKGLKTSKVKGFKRYVNVFGDVLHDLPKDLKDKFWEIYNKSVEENNLWNDFKYELMVEINESLKNGASEEEINDRINKLFDKLQLDMFSDDGFYNEYYEAEDWT